MILVSKFIVGIALSDKTYLSVGLLSPLTIRKCIFDRKNGVEGSVLQELYMYHFVILTL